MIPAGVRGIYVAWRIPRESGDDPDSRTVDPPVMSYSPRERG